MGHLTAPVAAAAALLLIWGGASHAAAPARLRAALSGVLGPRFPGLGLIASGVIATELAVGAAVLALSVWPAEPWATAALSAQALVYAGFSGYLGVAYLAGRRAACGCPGATTTPIGPAVIARAATLMLGTLLSALTGPADPPRQAFAGTADSLPVVVVPALALALLAHVMPAIADPSPRRTGDHAKEAS